MKSVLVLLDDELQRSRFLRSFGRSSFGVASQPPTMCRIMTADERRIFRYEVFGLMTRDKKLEDLISSKDGLVVILRRCDKEISDRIKEIVKSNPDTPIMLILEGLRLEKLPNWFVTNHRQWFTLDQYRQAEQWFYIMMKSAKIRPSSSSYTSRNIPIDEMIRRFESRSLEMELWDHYGRLRVVFYYLLRDGFGEAINPEGDLCQYWKAYKQSVGHGKLWHYTLTRFWTTILYQLHQLHPDMSFDQLYHHHPKIQSGRLFQNYYSEERLFSDQARKRWMDPDIKRIA